MSVVNQTVTLGTWVGHETLVAFPGIGARRGGRGVGAVGGAHVLGMGWIQ